MGLMITIVDDMQLPQQIECVMLCNEILERGKLLCGYETQCILLNFHSDQLLMYRKNYVGFVYS